MTIPDQGVIAIPSEGVGIVMGRNPIVSSAAISGGRIGVIEGVVAGYA
ncbi:MAG: hypothetical protein Q9M48_00305 [Rhodobacterales bacterium]|nr:hypothetical protein [Rhodobacterales bacterium]